MKRIVAILMAICCAVLAALPAAADASYIRGDADNNGEVNILDATVIQRYLADLSVSSFSETAADVNNNGVDIMDATAIQRHLVDFDDGYGIGETVTVADPATEPPTQPQTQKPTRDPDELPFVPKR